MPKINLTDLVLDTIDTISARKNRPNLLRIYRHLNKLYDLSFTTCETLLKALLVEGKVIRVTYKGNISYRNALKWKKYSCYMKKTMGTELPGSLLTSAVSELIVQEPDYLNLGIPCHILEQHLLSMKDENINKEAIQKLLQRELNLESLLLENGNYFLGPNPVETPLFEHSKLKTIYRNIQPKENMIDSAVDTNSCDLISNHDVIEGCSEKSTVTECDNEGSKLTTDEDIPRTGNGSLSEQSKLLEKVSSEVDVSNDTAFVIESSNLSGPTNDCLIENSDKTTACDEAEGTNDNLKSNEKSQDDHRSSSSPENSDRFESNVVKTVYNDIEMEVESNSALCSSDDHIESVKSISEVNKIIGVSNDFLDEKEASSSHGSRCSSPGKVKTSNVVTEANSSKLSDNEEESDDKDVKKSPPTLERVKRKKKTKYDASDYYFPSLKRRSRDAFIDGDRKDDKRKKKKKKKENGPTNLSGVFAKRVMFPGNSSMCCECNCYVSKVKLDPMIFCTTCSNQGHQSCASKTMEGKNWYCADCRQDAEVCKICEKMPHEKDRGILYSCYCCGENYHKGCHNPSIKLPFSTSWHCFSCPPVKKSSNLKDTTETPEQERSILKVKTESSDRRKKNNVKESKTENMLSFFKDEPPDPSNWSSQDVYKYFIQYFSNDVAKIILDQDIDGYSLKLLGRADVLKLDFNLGICLKILFHIKRLQLRTNNLVELWKD